MKHELTVYIISALEMTIYIKIFIREILFFIPNLHCFYRFIFLVHGLIAIEGTLLLLNVYFDFIFILLKKI